MTTRPSKIKVLLLSLALCMLLILNGCGNKKAESKEAEDGNQKTENQTNQTENEENQKEESSSEELFPYSFIPKFEEQVIYDKDGIKLTAIYHPDGANSGFDFNYIMYCKIENSSKHTVQLLPVAIQTRDGFLFRTVSLMSEIEPGQEATDAVSFNPVIAFSDKSGHDTLFQEYGLASVLGDFRLHFKILEAETNEHLIVDTSDYIKTEKGDTSYDYSQIQNKTTLIDQNGIKVHLLDYFILPPDEKSFVESTYYCILTYYENQNEEEYLLNLEWPKMDGKEYDVMLPSWGYDPKSKGFEMIQFDIEALEEDGFKNFEELEFTVRASKLIDKEKRNFEEVFVKENVLIKLSKDWKTREINK